MKLTRARLKELLRYDRKSGAFFWLVDRGMNPCSGKIAGHHRKDTGRWNIRIDGRDYAASRLACFYMTGRWPRKLVDHRDGNPSVNAWRNIREASDSQNQQNQRAAHRDSTHGFLGATFNRHKQKWASRICVSGYRKLLGYFDDVELAHLVYLSAKQVIHPFQEIV